MPRYQDRWIMANYDFLIKLKLCRNVVDIIGKQSII